MCNEKKELEKRRETVRNAISNFEKCIGKKLDELNVTEQRKESIKWFLNFSNFPEDALFWFGAYYMKDLYNL